MSCSGCLRNAYKTLGSRKECLGFLEIATLREKEFTSLSFSCNLHPFVSGFFCLGMSASELWNGCKGDVHKIVSPHHLCSPCENIFFVPPVVSGEWASPIFPSEINMEVD